MAEQMTKPESELKVAGMFDRVAPRYDLLNLLLSCGQDRRWRKKMLSLLPLGPEGVLLDVATGTGDVLISAAKSQPSWQKLVGADISANMLAEAEKKAAAAGVCRKVSFRQMSAMSLDLPDNFCHAITIAFGLRNVVDKEKALAEFSRVLKPGGQLFILEFFQPDNGLLARAFQFYFHHILPRIGGVLSDREAYRYLPESVESFYLLPDLNRHLVAQGMQNIRTISWLFGACRLVQAKKIVS